MRAHPDLVRAALAEVAAIGPYFAISTDPGVPGTGDLGASRSDGQWRPLSELAADTAALRARIDDFRRRLGTEESRVAASILFQGLAARLWSPVIGTVTTYGLVPARAPADLRWRPAPTGPLPLWTSPVSGWHVVPELGKEWPGEPILRTSQPPASLRTTHASDDSPAEKPTNDARADQDSPDQRAPGRETADEEVAAVVYRVVVADLLEPLVDAVRGITKISAGLLWGNAASSLAGTLRTLPATRPDLAPRAARLVRDVLGLGVLAGTGRLAEPAAGHHFFVRSSCCLYYRVPGGGMCDDCALLAPPVRDRQWARTVRQARGAGT
ncbi:hypothetical protein Sme01_35490 [Sphaerisporangium melleum]|uniref:(2Fe-2S)-binding protein n=1 Tax=Sphaerisporangium melleum TaxID=321316 RepID=UPI00194E1378|nr:(2Fe-2S)-binding protein [Sphaerisporangium melleum]GII71073.1 hypothetical protein Sme01_35490 [Sphaerisporangium melleum]